MPSLKLVWTSYSKLQFDELRQHASATGKGDEFIKVHNEIIEALRDLDQALEKGEPLYNTRKPGGLVRQWVHEFISATYVVFPVEGVGWFIKYQPVPASWPD